MPDTSPPARPVLRGIFDARFILAVLLLVLTFGCAHTTQHEAATQPDDAVNALLDEDYEATMKNYPTWASMLGDRRYDTELTDNSPKVAKRRAIPRDAARAKAISTEGLSDAAKTNLQLFIWEQEESVESAKYRSEWTPISQMGGPHTSFPQLANRITFTTEKHHEDYVTRIGKIAGSLENTLNHLKAGLAAEHTPPKIVMAGVMGQMKAKPKPLIAKIQRRTRSTSPLRNGMPMIRLRRKLGRLSKMRFCQPCKSFDYLETTTSRDAGTTAAKDGPGGMEFYNTASSTTPRCL